MERGAGNLLRLSVNGVWYMCFHLHQTNRYEEAGTKCDTHFAPHLYQLYKFPRLIQIAPLFLSACLSWQREIVTYNDVCLFRMQRN